ncbi:DUF1302 domain-containing protein [Paraburkholderia sp. MM5384-R2]|uniref:DUF1302 domain-containing protein n=1 Tax=Paraburkholderia sp. MM5384-R2 TaxID=2723097 RepID=UPI00160C3675|nr:DUF1302 domain-containing protein [Paraburkholderia sp. MM5384-R2]MBB5497599.1 hypothetical protein [Paraburkholderia sp. MM5384-R2]
MEHCKKPNHRMSMLALAAAVCATPQAHAFNIDTGNDDLSVRWDNTLKYSNAFRVHGQDESLLTGNVFSANTDDGNRNFKPGLISNRVDWLSELDVVYAQRYGFRVSGAAWYDSVYNTYNDNNSPGTSNRFSGAYNTFNPTTRTLQGRDVELLDAFMFGGIDIGSTRLNVRAGQHSAQWGESLFFGINAIAGAMAPIDAIKLASVPSTQFKEAILPVPQLSAQWQLTPAVSVGAYYQFTWKANRLPPAGSYFSGLDFMPEGGEGMYIPGSPNPLLRGANQDAKNSGQGGLQVRFSALDTDFGLYAVRFNSKSPQIVNDIGAAGVPTNYHLVYHEGITALGASASHTFGDIQVAIEASIRNNQDLASTGSNDVSALTGTAANDNSGNPAYAVGRTAHMNASTLWTLPSSPLAREASLTAEVMWNRVLSVTKNPQALDPNSTRDAWAFRMVLEPTYRQVLPGLDISVPLGLGWSPRGSRSQALGPSLPATNGGDMSIGLKGSYLDVWRFSLNYTHFYGPAATMMNGFPPTFTYGQFMKDRDFVALSISRTL